MSMLSAQCDELRELATRYDELQAGAVKAVTMPSNMGPILRYAADNIWELRCKCADLMSEREEYVWTREFMDRMAKHCGTKDCPSLVSYVEGLEAENDKLREELDAAKQDLQVFSANLARLGAENAKLRELVRDYERCTMHADCSRCEYDGKLSTHCPLSPCFPDADELRELGVEVE